MDRPSPLPRWRFIKRFRQVDTERKHWKRWREEAEAKVAELEQERKNLASQWMGALDTIRDLRAAIEKEVVRFLEVSEMWHPGLKGIITDHVATLRALDTEGEQ